MAEKEKLFDPESYSECRAVTVIGLAKRASQIVDEANEQHIVLSEKPVMTAMRELEEGKIKLVRRPPEGPGGPEY